MCAAFFGAVLSKSGVCAVKGTGDGGAGLQEIVLGFKGCRSRAKTRVLALSGFKLCSQSQKAPAADAEPFQLDGWFSRAGTPCAVSTASLWKVQQLN